MSVRKGPGKGVRHPPLLPSGTSSGEERHQGPDGGAILPRGCTPGHYFTREGLVGEPRKRPEGLQKGWWSGGGHEGGGQGTGNMKGWPRG